MQNDTLEDQKQSISQLGDDLPPDPGEDDPESPITPILTTSPAEDPEPDPPPATAPKVIKKGVGRTRVDGEPSKTAKVVDAPTPSPLFKVYYSEAANPHARPDKAFKWWRELPSWAQQRLTIYVYRLWPVLLVPEKDERGIKEDHGYIDKLGEPLESITDLLNRYGSGDYKLMINDDVVDKRTICTINVRENWRDFRASPPSDRRIDDTRNVDLADPGNQNYIRYLRSQGKLPDQQKETRDMAESSAVTQVTQLLSKVLDKSLDKNSDRGQNDTTATVVKEVTQAMGEVNRQAGEILKGAYERGQQVVIADPVEQFVKMASAFKTMNPAPAQAQAIDPSLLSMFQTVLTIQSDRVNKAEEKVDRLLARLEAGGGIAPAQGAGAPAEQQSPKSVIKEALEVVQLIRGGNDQGGGAGGWMDKLPDILQSVAQMGQVALNAYQVNQVMAERKRAQELGLNVQPPPPPPPQIVQPPPQENRAADMAGAAVEEDELEDEQVNLIKFMEEIKRPLLNHINRNLGGAAFAEWMIDTYDEATYQQIKLQGAETLVMALKSYPPIAKELVGKDLLLPKFAEEFMSLELEQGDGEGDDEGEMEEEVTA